MISNQYAKLRRPKSHRDLSNSPTKVAYGENVGPRMKKEKSNADIPAAYGQTELTLLRKSVQKSGEGTL